MNIVKNEGLRNRTACDGWITKTAVAIVEINWQGLDAVARLRHARNISWWGVHAPLSKNGWPYPWFTYRLPTIRQPFFDGPHTIALQTPLNWHTPAKNAICWNCKSSSNSSPRPQRLVWLPIFDPRAGQLLGCPRSSALVHYPNNWLFD